MSKATSGQIFNYRYAFYSKDELKTSFSNLSLHQANLTNSDYMEIASPATQDYVLIELTIANKKQENLYLEIEDSNLDSIICYSLPDFKCIGLAGDWVLEKDKISSFELPTFLLPQKDTTSILLKVLKKEGGIIIPIILLSEEAIQQKHFKRDAFAFFYLGSLSILLVVMFVFFFVLRNKLYLLYSFYIFNLIVYYLTTFHYGGHYIWHNQPQLNDWLRAIFASLVFFSYSNFSIEFLELRKFYKILELVIKSISKIGLLFIFFSGPFSPFPKYINNYYFHFFNFLVALFLVLILISTIGLYRRKNKNVVIYLIAFFPILVGVINLIAMENGWVVKSLLMKNSLWIASLIESICFLVFITLRNKKTLLDKVLLEKNLIAKDLKLLEIEKLVSLNEKKSLSNELHDNILPLLIVVRRRLEMDVVDKEKDTQYLNEIINDLRKLSHGLNHISRSKNDLEEAIKHLLAIDVQIEKSLIFEWSESELNEDFKNDVYKIFAELFANAIKHSNCSKIEIEFRTFPNELNFLFEDDGIGLGTKQESKGIGLLNIKQNITKYNGDLQIITSPKKGSKFTIKFKQNVN